MSVEDLRVRITNILQNTPTEQLATISTKDVRAQLLQAGDIDKRWLKENKDQVKELIQSVFEAVSAHLVPALPPTDDDGIDFIKQDDGAVTTNGGYTYPTSNGVYSSSYTNGRGASGSQSAEYDEDGNIVASFDAKPATSAPPKPKTNAPPARGRGRPRKDRVLAEKEENVEIKHFKMWPFRYFG